MEKVLTISEVSRRSGVASSALRFYEDRGLIESHRAGSGHRRFARSVLRRVAFIVFAQRVGLSLDEISEELSKLPTNRIPTSKDWSRLIDVQCMNDHWQEHLSTAAPQLCMP